MIKATVFLEIWYLLFCKLWRIAVKYTHNYTDAEIKTKWLANEIIKSWKEEILKFNLLGQAIRIRINPII